MFGYASRAGVFASAGLAAAILASTASNCSAFDPNAGVSKDSGPGVLFRFGYQAYKSGQKSDAVEAYRYAAEQGHTASQWALAKMYASGDGVSKDDYEAFKIFSQIARAGVEPGSAEGRYFSNALTSLADYYKNGIAHSPVKPDLSIAWQLYFQAASTFGDDEAQFRLAQMILAGEGGRDDVQQAKKWLNLARKKGHMGATALFGNLIFQEGKRVRGLAFMTNALNHCSPKDCEWMSAMQEKAFSVASEDERRGAVALASDPTFLASAQ
ncbi:tetratricopeptide repeat protein [Rhizobium sp. L1K21]|uniref:tetratricopeptide repeat protein n=1 Tax=Rhizobium sp. L1K21 TaxID=2954933 RepID=UPI002091E9C1|nr:tetratricopeptide repeat protein [Rhizobium sp. L1K21]MCO6186163.1 sel1 repeat family protein [Rhizobium sp. L1K21]